MVISIIVGSSLSSSLSSTQVYSAVFVNDLIAGTTLIQSKHPVIRSVNKELRIIHSKGNCWNLALKKLYETNVQYYGMFKKQFHLYFNSD